MIRMIINGDNNDVNNVKLTGVRCISGCAPPPPTNLPVEDRVRFWSVLADWDGRLELPKDGDEVVIPSHWNMMYDIVEADTPKLESLEINGRLSFMPGADRILKAYNLWVRSGELNIGESGNPFPNQATIELQGDNTEEYFAFTRAIEAGNKNLVITGNVNMHGLPRDLRSRMLMSSFRGDDFIVVSKDLDWVAGEKVVIAPTNMRTMDTDICTIKSYQPGSGVLECEEMLMGFHFGADESTEAKYGVDMRAEVALLSRNVKITASQGDMNHILQEPWQCRILVSDFFESNAEMTLRVGSLIMDNVQVDKCGQKFTWKSAIKFENALQGSSSITNSAIHEGKSPGVIITKSMNIEMSNNVIAEFAEHGVWVQNSRYITLDNNWLFNVIEEQDKEP